MEDKIKVFYVKGLGKAAFSVAFGLTVGKAIGDLVSALIGGATGGIVQGMAKHGNGVAQKACDKQGIKYETDPGESESEK